MTCARVERRLDAYVDGELRGRAAAAVAAHLEGCSACRQQAAAFERLAADLRGLAAEPVPAHLASRAVDRWVAERPRRPLPACLRPALAMGVAGLLLVARFWSADSGGSPAVGREPPGVVAATVAQGTALASPGSGSRVSLSAPPNGQKVCKKSPAPSSKRARRFMANERSTARSGGTRRGEPAARWRGRPGGARLARRSPILREPGAREQLVAQWVTRGRYHEGRGEYGQAAAAYEQAFAAAPDPALALAAGQSAESAGDIAGAVTYYTRLFDAAPEGEQE